MDLTTLGDLLEGSGGRVDAAEALRLAHAAAAAPPIRPADAWVDLIAASPTADQRAALDGLRTAAVAGLEDGLDTAPPPTALRARLNAVREAMTARGYDGFLIPRSDAHQNEMVARRDQRLSWTLGFTGSAGLALLLRDICVLFVDGRYGVQARMETDADSVEVVVGESRAAADWMRAQAPRGARIAYDPWLHPPATLGPLAEACAAAGARLEPAGDNPVDAAWAGRAERPMRPVWAHARDHTGMDAAEKRARIAGAIASDGADAAILTDPSSIAWLLNIRGGDLPFTPLPLAFAILHSDGRVALFSDVRKFDLVRGHLGDGVMVRDWRDFGAALDALGRGGAKRGVRVDPCGAPDWIFQRLAATEAEIRHGDDPCALPKSIKTAAEVDGARACHIRDGAALVRFFAWLDDARTCGAVLESEAATTLEAFRAEDPDFLSPSFETIAGAGPNGAIVHYRATPRTDRPLEDGTLFLLDSGGHYLDGTTDVTRTIACGAPDAEMKDRFTRVLRGHIALATVLFPEGTTGGQIDAFARRPLWAIGRDFDHGVGHGVGSVTTVHEGPPRLSKASRGAALAPGMILSNEPGCYREGAYGVRLENLELVVAVAPPVDGPDARALLGFEALTLAPFDRTLIEPSLLANDDMDWLDAYHGRVRETLGPALEQIGDDRALRWLDAATAPLMRWWARPSPSQGPPS